MGEFFVKIIYLSKIKKDNSFLELSFFIFHAIFIYEYELTSQYRNLIAMQLQLYHHNSLTAMGHL